LEALRDQIKKDFGADVTIVANIAGINNKALILDLDKKKVDAMIDINLKSHFYTAMLFLPAMIKRKRGHFLSISSTMGYAGICHQSDYVAAKHGVVGMQESLYYEMQKMYKTPKVRTSIAIIGHTKTPLFDTFDVGPVGRFMGPLLEPSYVASLLVDAFEAQETRIITTPFSVQTAAGIKAYPQFMRDALQALSGADGSYPTRPTAQQLGH
jgi:short-subunit dehydrogenase